MNIDPVALRRFLIHAFSLDDLKTLCFEHLPEANPDLPWQAPPSAVAREWVLWCERHGKLAILAQAAQQARPATWASFTTQRPSVCQLRPITREFVGRAAEIDALIGELRQSGRVAISSAIVGMGGVGKTELANYVAHEVQADYPDAQLLIPLGTHSGASPMTPRQALGYVITALHPTDALPDDEAALQHRYRLALHGKRVLIIADDAGDEAVISQLMPPAGCALIATARKRLEGLPPHELPTLPANETMALLRQFRPSLSEAEAGELAQAVGYLPIAISVVGGHLRANKSKTARRYLDELRQLGLKALRSPARQLDVSAVFEASYNTLASTQQALFRALAVMPASFDRYAAQAVARTGAEAEADAAPAAIDADLDTCVNLHLLTYDEQRERFNWHDLMRQFAQQKLRQNPIESTASELGYANYYTSVAQYADDLYTEGHNNITDGLTLFDAERVHIEHAFEIWQSQQDPAQCIALVLGCVEIALLRFPATQNIRWQSACTMAAEQIGDRFSHGAALGNLGGLYWSTGRYADAEQHSQQLLSIASEIGDRSSQAKALGNLGLVYLDTGRYAEAEQHLQQWLSIATQIGNRASQAKALGNLGLVYLDTGRYADAEQHLQQLLSIASQIGDRASQAAALGNLGGVYLSTGRYADAEQHLQQQLNIASEIGDRASQGKALGNLGLVYLDTGRYADAEQHFQQGLSIASEIGNQDSSTTAQWNLGDLAEKRGDLARAIELMQKRVDFKQAIGHPDAVEQAEYVNALRQRLRESQASS